MDEINLNEDILKLLKEQILHNNNGALINNMVENDGKWQRLLSYFKRKNVVRIWNVVNGIIKNYIEIYGEMDQVDSDMKENDD